MTTRLMGFAIVAALAVTAGLSLVTPAAAVNSGVVAPPTYEIGDRVPAKRVAVMNLNVSGEYSEQVREWLPAMIEEYLLKEGWTLVVRGQRMNHIQQERNLPGIKPETRLPDNELLGATTFLELNARIQVKDIQGIVGYKIFSLGDYARASVDLNGQIVDPATGVLKSSISVGGSASGLKTIAVVTVASGWRIGAGGYNLRGVRESLVGKAADTAAKRLLERLNCLYGPAPAMVGGIPLQPNSTTVAAEKSGVGTILIDLPDSASSHVGDKYGVYRGDEMIAQLELVRVSGKRGEAKIIKQTGPILPSDKARKITMLIGTD